MLYYFDRNLLDEVVRQYASAYVTGPVYDDGDATPETPSDSMSDNVLTMDGTSAPVANDYVFSFEDCKSVKATHKETGWSFDVQPDIPFGEQATLSGVYTITETDEAGNENSYEVIVDHDAPALNVTLELYGTGTSQITVDPEIESTLAPYYCKSFRIDSVVDADPWAVVSVTKNGKTDSYTQGDVLPTLTEGGEYTVEMHDRLGNSSSFTVYVAGEEPLVEFRDSADGTEVSLDITLSEEFDSLISLEVYRDGQKLEGITPDNLDYVFDRGGTYRVVLKDCFGRTVEKEYVFDKAKPEGTLTGVEEGGKTDTDVSISYDAEECHAEIRDGDGNLLATDTDGLAEFSGSGDYVVRIIRNDDPDSYRDYSFTIDLDAPVIEATGAEDGGKTNADLTIGWEDKDVATATVSKDGTYNGITCDYDGYPTFMGAMLVDHYSDKKKVKTLLSLGDLSELERRIAPDPRQKRTFLVRQNFSCVFYGREKGDYTRMARTFKREDLKDTYAYIFKDGEWYMPQGEKDKKVIEVLDEIYLKEGFPRPKNFYGYLREEDKIGFCAQYQEKIRQDHIALQKQRAKEAMEMGY